MSSTDYTALLPPLSESQFAELRADIAERGCLVPIELDDDGQILDGAHRLRACQELNIKPPTITRRGLSEDEKRAHAIALNIQRRQLDRGQRAELHRELRKAGKSVREIAEISGSAKSTVSDDLAPVRDRTPEITGRDGKTYPATKPKPAPVLDFPGAQTVRQAKRQEGRADREQAKADKREASVPTADWKLIHSPVADLELDEPVDAIITDPPYPREYLGIYWPDCWAFRVTPVNARAQMVYSGNGLLTEQRFVESLYHLRGLKIEEQVYRELSTELPEMEVAA